MAERSRRLLWIHQNFVSRAHAGNERPVYTVAGLLERGWKIDLVTGTAGYQGTILEDAEALRREGGLSWHRLTLPSNGDYVQRRGAHYLSFLRRVQALARTLEAPDLVFASTPPLPQTMLALRLAWHAKVPLILEVRDLWPAFLEALGLAPGCLTVRTLRWMEAFAYRAADSLVSVSPAFRPYLEGFGVEPEKIFDAPHGAAPRDIDAAQAAGRKWREQQGLNAYTVLLYAGSLNESHGIERLLEAAQTTAGEAIMWILAGGGRAAGRARESAKRLPNLQYLGALPRRELDTLYGACDASIVMLEDDPVLASVMPGKLIDSLSVAVPVICAVPGQPAALVEHSGSGWHCAATASALAFAARLVANTPREDRLRRGEAGRQFVRGHCASEGQARGIAQLCDDVVSGARSSRSRIAGAGIRALGDLASGRARRLVRALYDDPRGLASRAAFEAWLARSVTQSVWAPIAIPSILE